MARLMLRDILLFLKGIRSHLLSIVMGGVVFMLLMLWERDPQRRVPPLLYWLAVGGAFLVATFRTWQVEKRRATKAEAELAQMKAADAGLIKRNLTDVQFWLLCLIEANGARREMFSGGIESHTHSAVFLGNSPISNGKSRWLYDLMDDAVRSGLLALAERGVVIKYSIPADIQASLPAYRRLHRPIEVPKGILYDARTGQPVEFNI